MGKHVCFYFVWGFILASLGLAFAVQAEPVPETLAWALQIGGSSGDDITCIEPFADGSFVVGGYCQNDFYLSTPPEAAPYPHGPFIAKYDARRRLLWVKRFEYSVFPRFIEGTGNGQFVLAGFFFNGVTLGAGEPNGFSVGAPIGSFVASYNADGTLKWGSVCTSVGDVNAGCEVWGLAVSPDGTVYSAYRGWGGVNFETGSPQQTSVNFTNAQVVVCHSNEGELRSITQSPWGSLPLLVAMDGFSISVDPAHHVARSVNSTGSVLWSDSQQSWTSMVRIPGTRSLIAAAGDTFYKLNVAQNGAITQQWERQASIEPSTIKNVYAYADGSGYLLLELGDGEALTYGVLPFSSDGTVGAAFSPEFYDSFQRLHLAPTPPAFYAFGNFTDTETFGWGQAGETTLSSRGAHDSVLGLYGQDFGYVLNASSAGNGVVVLNPRLSVYPPGTEVTAYTEPIFPSHDQFSEWQGDLAAYTEPEVTFTVENHMDFTAVFEEIPGAPPLPALSLAGLAVLASVVAGVGLARRK